MADIFPFPAIRPTPDKASLVVSRSFETYSESQREMELERNPHSFLHILNPGFKFNKKLKRKKRFKGVRKGYLEFLEKGILLRDTVPAYYLYQSSSADHTSFGIFCATSVHDYRNGVIRRHEATLKKREKLFADYLKTVRFNAEPVLMTYPHSPQIQELLSDLKKSKPAYDFTTADQVSHKMWIISQPKAIEDLTRSFSQIPVLYIADGHHRVASSNVLAHRLQAKEGQDARAKGYECFMSYLVDESQLKIGSYSRLVTDLNGMDAEEVLTKLRRSFHVRHHGQLAFEPKEKYSFGMFLDGSFYELHLRESAYGFSDALSRLDCCILNKEVLEPILGITDLRTDSRISYRNSPRPALDVRLQVESGRYAVGFTMQPVSLKEIRQVADAGLIMPPKTSYMEPKLRSGLTIYDINLTNDHS